MRNLKAAGAALTLLATAAMCSVQAAGVGYTTPGSTYSQSFDTLPNTPVNTSFGLTPIGWTDDNAAPGAGNFSIVGWYLYHLGDFSTGEGGANGHQRVRAGTGSANTGSFWSYGPTDSTERALGSLASNTTTPSGSQYMGLLLQNSTGVTLGSFTLGYNGEQWRDGGAATPNQQSLVFGWSTTAAAISDTGFNDVAELGYNSPVFVNTSTGAAVDGNTAGRVVVGPFTVENINWAPDAYLWLRWADANNTGNDHGFAIDDLTFSAAVVVPEPSSTALFALGVVGLILRRKG